MNRIVREHYPADKLPDDLRAGLPEGGYVTVSVEPENARQSSAGHFSRWRHLQRPHFNTADEAIAHVRALRDNGKNE